MITVYWLPNCTTCQKAVQYLEKSGAAVSTFRDIKSDRLSRDEVERLAELTGGASELFSQRAIKYRAMKLNERELATREMIQLMVEEYTFIKRPVVVSGKRAVAGFTPKSFDRFLDQTWAKQQQLK